MSTDCLLLISHCYLPLTPTAISHCSISHCPISQCCYLPLLLSPTDIVCDVSDAECNLGMKHMTPFDYTRQQEAKLKEMGVEFEPVSSSVYFQTEEKRCMGFIEAWQAIGSPMLRPKQGLDGKWTEAEKIES